MTSNIPVDMIIKNGHVVDPAQDINVITDVVIDKGKIVCTGDSSSYGSANIIDAKGKIVTPGLIDFHGHFFKTGCDFSVAPDAVSFVSGVTTVVDAGSAGTATYDGLRVYEATMQTKIKNLINVSPTGLGTLRYHENIDPRLWNRDKLKEIYSKYRDELIGLKVRQSANVVGELGLSPLKEAIKFAEELDCRVVVHVTAPPCEQFKIAELLRKDDVFCHVFQGSGYTIINEHGKVHAQIKEARARGCLFDACNGWGHFSFDVAEKALEDGFMPDILSTDITMLSLYNNYVFSLPVLMSKYLYLGVSLYDIVKMVTETPAKAMYMQNKVGCLCSGADADVAIFELRDHKIKFRDTLGVERYGEKVLIPKLTLQNGNMMYKSIDY